MGPGHGYKYPKTEASSLPSLLQLLSIDPPHRSPAQTINSNHHAHSLSSSLLISIHLRLFHLLISINSRNMNIIKRFSIILLLVLLSLTANVGAYKKFNEPIKNRIHQSNKGSSVPATLPESSNSSWTASRSAMVVSALGLGLITTRLVSPGGLSRFLHSASMRLV